MSCTTRKVGRRELRNGESSSDDDDELTEECTVCNNNPCRCDEIYDRWHDAPYDEF